jgi:hypothetical protein
MPRITSGRETELCFPVIRPAGGLSQCHVLSTVYMIDFTVLEYFVNFSLLIALKLPCFMAHNRVTSKLQSVLSKVISSSALWIDYMPIDDHTTILTQNIIADNMTTQT